MVGALADVAAGVVREADVGSARGAQEAREPAQVERRAQHWANARTEARPHRSVVVAAPCRVAAARAPLEAEVALALHAEPEQEHGARASVARDEALDLARRREEAHRQLARAHAQSRGRIALERSGHGAAGIVAAILEGTEASDEHER